MPLIGNIVTGGLRMSKYISKSARKRIPMTSKMGNKNFYKGKGATKEGTINSRAGRFIVDPEKRLEIIAPDLDGFKLKPYVSKAVWKPRRGDQALLDSA
ncbi:unnamed protein product [Ectocarpus sp. 13 AM-2016]